MSSESRSAYRGGGPVKLAGGGEVHPRAGTQGLAKRGYKAGGLTGQEDSDMPKHKKGKSLTADEDTKMKNGGCVMDKDDHPMMHGDRVKKAVGGMVAPMGAVAGTSSGALQNQGAIIGAKKRRKMTKLGALSAPSKPQASPPGAFPVVASGKNMIS